MNTTEKNIKKLLINNNELKNIDVELENKIIDKINSRPDYKIALIKTKRNAKIGIILSLILFVVYGIITYLEILTSNNINESSLTKFYPTIFTVLVVIVVYFEMTFGVSVFKKSTQSQQTVVL